MTTTAYHEGRMAGYYGNVESANPYLKGWAKHSIIHCHYADEWNRGYAFGVSLRTASNVDLMRALNNFGNLITS